MIKHKVFCLIVFFFLVHISAQEIKVFRTTDFDLNGAIKTCKVITDYGQEIFEFDRQGRLVRVTTQYNEEDRDITTYMFQNAHLVEKRTESYKNDTIDLSSSMAHFYTIDSTGNKKVIEQIVSYDKEFIEAQEYQYTSEGDLSKIMVSHENAVDEITIEETAYKDEKTVTYFENSVIQKSIRESVKKGKNQELFNVILVKNYVDGEPNTAEEKVFDAKGLLRSEEYFQFDGKENEFKTHKNHRYEYNEENILFKEIINQGNVTSVKEYIFQFDNNEDKNWVKKITTPDNTFITRKLVYYPKPSLEEEHPEE